MRTIFGGFFRAAGEIFSFRHLYWHMAAILLTAAIVFSGFDWEYYVYFRDTVIYRIGFTAAPVGFIVPIVLPIAVYVLGRMRGSKLIKNAAYAVVRAEILALLITWFYKALTGRAHPAFSGDMFDITRQFDFGFLEGGVFNGWPSSHTAIAFASAVALAAAFRYRASITVPALLYALYIGIGVSMTVHWLSDAVAGAIFGTLVGVVVGRIFVEHPVDQRR